MAVTSFFSAFIVYKHISFISFTGILQNLPKNFTTVLSVVKFCSILCEIITISGGIHMSIVSDIEKLKKEKNAVILAHYYVDEDVQDVADYIGDSFYLSKVATKVSQDRIIFAGVEFMGESAKILNPKKRVFMPDMNADCPMAHMADKDEILALREKYDDLAVVCYINSTAELKKYSDELMGDINGTETVFNTGNITLDGIFNYYNGKFKDKCIETDINVVVPENMGISAMDINIIMGNLLDNAYENAIKVKDSYIKVNVKYNGNMLYIYVSNTFDGKVEEENGNIVSLKGKEHGYGLENINRIAEKYGGNIKIEHSDKRFVVSVIMYIIN